MEENKFQELKKTLWKFMREDIYPNEQLFHEQCIAMEALPGSQWTQPKIINDLIPKAKKLGLFNLWLSTELSNASGFPGGGLSNVQYGECCEIMGTSNHMEFAAQVCNCSSPDTGNMETLLRFGNESQKQKWVVPLLEGKIKSCFGMTEPNVASSDATNISIDIERVGNNYVINGRKTYITGAGSDMCKIMILMGKIKNPQNPGGGQFKSQSMILIPTDTPGITYIRPMATIGDYEAPKGHMEIEFVNVKVPVENILGGEGRGFEIAQARLGPGRIHHCMRLLGTGERAISIMCKRGNGRVAFGKKISEFDTVLRDIAQSRIELDQARLLVKHAAHLLDTVGSKHARKELSMVKTLVPKLVLGIVDRAMQVHGALGVSQDTFLPTAFIWCRWLRFADGPGEVHARTVARLELREQERDSVLYALPNYENRRPIHKQNPPSKL